MQSVTTLRRLSAAPGAKENTFRLRSIYLKVSYQQNVQTENPEVTTTPGSRVEVFGYNKEGLGRS
ncbi:hypothetical protein SDC9_105188 [bioreactor metagenome]|uniref:Uncharacterized protein n=1 Tax=bioreactor metagenome TaxID=1076179 RepID=A0A645AYW2_9ZZZZ